MPSQPPQAPEAATATTKQRHTKRWHAAVANHAMPLKSIASQAKPDTAQITKLHHNHANA